MANEIIYKKSISIRTDERMEDMLEELEEKLLLNATSVMRLALATLYEQQFENEGDSEWIYQHILMKE